VERKWEIEIGNRKQNREWGIGNGNRIGNGKQKRKWEIGNGNREWE
jgi:hypothetical protein